MTFYVAIHVTLQEKVCFQILLTGAIPWQQWVADMATQLRITVPLPSSSSTVPVLLPEPNTTISFIVQQQANMMASIDRLNQTLQAQAMQPHFFPPVPPSHVANQPFMAQAFAQEQEAHLDNLEQLISAVNAGTFQEQEEQEVEPPPAKKQRGPAQDNVFILIILFIRVAGEPLQLESC